mmetsp:Transcript_54659/g.116796  ORF Transcript_54659/g.116796 Transcript_54659/m.116796 type:complete len:231 (-) Transcript_54659:647-1339(-)
MLHTVASRSFLFLISRPCQKPSHKGRHGALGRCSLSPSINRKVHRISGREEVLGIAPWQDFLPSLLVSVEVLVELLFLSSLLLHPCRLRRSWRFPRLPWDCKPAACFALRTWRPLCLCLSSSLCCVAVSGIGRILPLPGFCEPFKVLLVLGLLLFALYALSRPSWPRSWRAQDTIQPIVLLLLCLFLLLHERLSSGGGGAGRSLRLSSNIGHGSCRGLSVQLWRGSSFRR